MSRLLCKLLRLLQAVKDADFLLLSSRRLSCTESGKREFFLRQNRSIPSAAFNRLFY